MDIDFGAEFNRFMREMREKYDEKEKSKGDTFRTSSPNWMYSKLQEEFDEIVELIRLDFKTYDKEKMRAELVDLALVAFMCWVNEEHGFNGGTWAAHTSTTSRIDYMREPGLAPPRYA